MSETATNDSLEDFPPPSNQIYLESRRLRRRGGLLLLNGSEQLAEFKQQLRQGLGGSMRVIQSQKAYEC